MKFEETKWGLGGGQVVFQRIAKHFGLRTFIETGLAHGTTLSFVRYAFDECYSIERNDWHYDLGLLRFEGDPRVHLIHGDSGVELRRLLQTIPVTPTLFWLDAHGEVGEDAGPLAQELGAIVELRPDALVAIDDVGPSRHHDPGLSQVRETVALDGWRFDYRVGRVLFLHRGQYEIPPLE